MNDSYLLLKIDPNGVGKLAVQRELTPTLLFRYVNEIVATRKLPSSAETIAPKVVMKMDIEVCMFFIIKG